MIAGGILLAVVGWAFTFGLGWGSFWLKIGATVAVVAGYSLVWQRPRLAFRWGSVGLGAASAALLYAVFVVGNAVAPQVVPGASHQVGGIYDLGVGSSRVWVGLLLLLVTGPGEEIFWRGFLQQRLADRHGPVAGFCLATLVYAGVHVFSLNLMLVLAALVAGAFWGALWLWKRDLVLLIVSHSLWSAVIFAVAPVR